MIPYLTVSENIFLGRYPMKNGGIDWKTMNEKAQKLVDDLGVDIDVKQLLNTYGTAKQQIISIIRAISLDSKLIVMDEPTSSLDTNEVEILFGIIDKLRADNIAVIFISHRLMKYMQMRQNFRIEGRRLCWNIRRKRASQLELLNKMIGNKDLQMDKRREHRDFSDAPVILEAKHLVRTPYVNDVSFQVKKANRRICGGLGAGRTETARILFGCDIPGSGRSHYGRQSSTYASPRTLWKRAWHSARKTAARKDCSRMYPYRKIRRSVPSQLSKGGFIQPQGRKKLSEDYIDKLAIKTPSCEQLIKNLSGGNQQR